MSGHTVFRLLTALGLAVGARLTLKSDPNLVVPGLRFRAVAEWFNAHGEIRNVPAYFLLAFCALLSVRPTLRRKVLGWVFAVAFLLEAMQLPIASRSFDPIDILMSWFGALAAFGLIALFPSRPTPICPGAKASVDSASSDALR